MATGQFPPLTTEQESALRDFAKTHGRRWKAILSVCWMAATADPTLHHLRNTHGPTWLAGYRLPATR